MNREYTQQILVTQKLNFDQINTSSDDAELLLKTQSQAVVNLMISLDHHFGNEAKEECKVLWQRFHTSKEEWEYEETYGGTSAIEKKQQSVKFEVALIQELHKLLSETIQNKIDEGELLV